MEETLRLLVEFVKTASPLVWDALLRQVYVNAATNCIWLLFLVLVLVVLIRAYCWSKHGFDEDRDSEWIIGIVFFTVGIVIVAVAIMFVVTDVVGYLFNPNYYVIRMILQNLK